MFHYCYIIQHLKTLESCVSQILLGNMRQQKSPWQTTLSTSCSCKKGHTCSLWIGCNCSASVIWGRSAAFVSFRVPNWRGSRYLGIVLLVAMTGAQEDKKKCLIIFQASTHVTSVNHWPKHVTWPIPVTRGKAIYCKAIIIKERMNVNSRGERIGTII